MGPGGRVGPCVWSVVMAVAWGVVAMPGEAAGAAGRFVYTDTATGRLKALTDPMDAHCYQVSGRGHTENATNRTAELFDYPNCSGSPRPLRSGATDPDAAFASVWFRDVPSRV